MRWEPLGSPSGLFTGSLGSSHTPRIPSWNHALLAPESGLTASGCASRFQSPLARVSRTLPGAAPRVLVVTHIRPRFNSWRRPGLTQGTQGPSEREALGGKPGAGRKEDALLLSRAVARFWGSGLGPAPAARSPELCPRGSRTKPRGLSSPPPHPIPLPPPPPTPG